MNYKCNFRMWYTCGWTDIAGFIILSDIATDNDCSCTSCMIMWVITIQQNFQSIFRNFHGGSGLFGGATILLCGDMSQLPPVPNAATNDDGN